MWKSLLVSVAFATLVFAGTLKFKPGEWDKGNPLADINFKPLKTSAHRIAEHGYPSEHHHFETSDGYVLGLFRIPYLPKENNSAEYRGVVYLQHGLFSCSESFLLNGPENALAYLFADAGYDVWLGNARGNIYSRNNTKMTLNHPKWWNFSWHEIAVIDVAETIDYILELTGQKALHYVGHSQGGTAYFVLNSFKPEYNAKIKTGHLLAPAVFMGNTTHPVIDIFEPYVGDVGSIGERILEGQPFLPGNMFIQRALDTACGGDVDYPKFCATLFEIWSGPEAENINSTLIPQIAETHPAGISTNQGIHYIQLKHSNFFRQWDYGKHNMKHYDQNSPPDYPLDKITAPTYVYYGFNDTSVNYKDTERLRDENHLPNANLTLFRVPDPTWGHIDMIFAMKVKETIYDQLLKYCVDYDKENGTA